MSWVRWKLEILFLERESNQRLLHSEQVCQTFHHIGSLMSPPYPCLPVNVVPCLRGRCRLLHLSAWNSKFTNAYYYIQAITIQHIARSTTIQHIARTGSWSWPNVSWVWWKWEIMCLEQESNLHLLTDSMSISKHHLMLAPINCQCANHYTS